MSFLFDELSAGWMFAAQEGDLVNAYETTYQVDYNTGRYLQENPHPIAVHARNEPFQVTTAQ